MNFSVLVSSLVLIKLSIFVYFTWVQIGNIPKDKINIWTYVMRNTFAFYLGWCIAASNLNFGMDIVYLFDGTKKTQLIVFWILTPLFAIAAFTYNAIKHGKYGALSCFCLWFSVIWAFIGAAITSYRFLNDLQQLC